MNVDTLRGLYSTEAVDADGQFKQSGIEAERLLWALLKTKGWAKTNDNDVTAPDFNTPSGLSADLKLCKAHQYGGKAFHEVVQNIYNGSISQVADIYLYWDVLAPRAPLYIISGADIQKKYCNNRTQIEVAQAELKGRFHGVRLVPGGHTADKSARGLLVPTHIALSTLYLSDT